jgi:WD40 repeat protein
VLGFDPRSHDFATLELETGQLEWWHPDGQPAAPPVILPDYIKPSAGLQGVAASPAKGWLVTCGDRQPLRLRDWHTGKVLRSYPSIGPVSRTILSPDGSWLGMLIWPRSLHRLDLANGKWQKEPWMLGTGTVGPIRFSQDASLIASGGDDNLVTIRNASTGDIIATLKSHLAAVISLAFSEDGRTLASSSKDRTVRLWHVPTWRELGAIRRDSLDAVIGFTPQGLLIQEYQERWLLLPGKPSGSGP